jgi:hypothetical protein
MLYVLCGENEFDKRQKLATLIAGGAAPERYDGEQLDAASLRDIMQGQSLLALERTVIISRLSDNAALWAELPEITVSGSTKVVLLENKLDKRTKTYKWLRKNAEIYEFTPLNERQKPRLAKWCADEARKRGYTLSAVQAETLIDRLGYDQLRLSNFIEQLSFAGEITDDLLDKLTPLAKTESAFELFTAALAGNSGRIHEIIAYLEVEGGAESAYQTMGLLASQAVNLNALVLSGNDTGFVAADFSTSPYALRKLSSYANKINASQLTVVNKALFYADLQMKTTSALPWLLIETALIEVALARKTDKI